MGSFLKSSLEKLAEPNKFLIILGVLSGYIKHPFFFLVNAKLTFGRYRKKITLNIPSEIIDEIAFVAWIYIRLQKKVGREKAFEIVRVAITTMGLAIQQSNFKAVEAKRNFKNLIRYQKIANKKGSTKLNLMQIIHETENKYEFIVKKCIFYEIFSFLKVPELTSIFCAIDNAIFNSYLPEKIIFHRNGLNNTIATGKDFCSFVIEKIDN